jgi:hypothetical protein
MRKEGLSIGSLQIWVEGRSNLSQMNVQESYKVVVIKQIIQTI